MSSVDPIADLISIIKNGQSTRKQKVEVPFSKYKQSILEILEDQGYITSFEVYESNQIKRIIIELKYYNGEPVISSFTKISRSGRKVYKKSKHIPSVIGGYGVSIISTNKGVMIGQVAKGEGIGGEVICTIS